MLPERIVPSKDNTKPGFFMYWTKPQLIDECARLNQVLKEIKHIVEEGASYDSDVI